MNKLIEMIREFNNKFGFVQEEISNPNFIKLRTNLHEEEEWELHEEMWNCLQQEKITPNLLKEFADDLYVKLGTLEQLGLADKFEEAFTRVHNSNMSKVWPDGTIHRREDGKIIKPPTYQPPNLGDLV